MRILLTGGSGMVGRNVLEIAHGGPIQILAPRRSELDLTDRVAVEEWLRREQPDMIVHAAGTVGGIQANIAHPVRFLLDNLEIGINIVRAASNAGVSRLINLGSSCMYPRDGKSPLNEEQILNGQLEPTNEGYAIAKVAVARLCEYLGRERSDLRYKTLIPCNIYGRYDKFDPSHSHMVPAILVKLHKAKRAGERVVDIWGDGTSRREFMFARDLAHCILRAINHFDTLPDTMNVGLGYDFAVNDYYEIASRVVGWKGRFEHDLTKPVGMKQKLVDTTRASEWGWVATTSLEDGLDQTYRHYLELTGERD